MNKIFKYELKINQFSSRENYYEYCSAICPNGRVIRTDYVDDGFYKGHFVWMIVDPEDKDIQERKIQWIHNEKPSGTNIQIGVLESQILYLPLGIKIKAVDDYDGRFWMYYSDPLGSMEIEKVCIKGYKTGQEILDNIDDLEYIGKCGLWIKQELAVYFFKVK